jgi:hypothetical protein
MGEMKQCTLDVVKTVRGLLQLGNALTSMISPLLNYAYLLLLLLLQFMFCQMLILPKALGLGRMGEGTERVVAGFGPPKLTEIQGEPAKSHK